MISLNCRFRNKAYHFNSITGWLISKDVKMDSIRNVPHLTRHIPKAEKTLNSVLNPFRIQQCAKQNTDLRINLFLKIYVWIIIWFYKHFYPGIYLISKIRLNIYDNGIDAADAFCQIHPSGQSVLCLPRSIFIATTSKKFKQSGALFIGTFLPSRHMHAWVIEDRCNVYRHDYIWINFTPISMMV